MESIMQFIYLGEATYFEERMVEFLAVAKSLEIKDLCIAIPEPNDEPDVEHSSFDPVTLTENLEEQTVISDKTQAPQERQRSDVSVNGKYECDQCHKTYSGRTGLWQHNQTAHQGVKYACDQCDYEANYQSHLTRHIQSQHEGIKYACDQCDYQTKHPGDLTKHIQSKHEGVKYACDQCDYQATTHGSLTRHIQSKHEGVKYACDHCDYQFTQQSSLTRHMQLKH